MNGWQKDPEKWFRVDLDGGRPDKWFWIFHSIPSPYYVTTSPIIKWMAPFLHHYSLPSLGTNKLSFGYSYGMAGLRQMRIARDDRWRRIQFDEEKRFWMILVPVHSIGRFIYLPIYSDDWFSSRQYLEPYPRSSFVYVVRIFVFAMLLGWIPTKQWSPYGLQHTQLPFIITTRSCDGRLLTCADRGRVCVQSTINIRFRPFRSLVRSSFATSSTIYCENHLQAVFVRILSF